MNFIQDGANVHCVRSSNNESNCNQEQVVASFDSRLSKIPPHVKSLLYPDELDNLKKWLDERQEIIEESFEQNLLDVLPELLAEGIKAIYELDCIDKNTHASLLEATRKFYKALSSCQHVSVDIDESPHELDEHQAVVERLNQIKNKLL